MKKSRIWLLMTSLPATLTVASIAMMAIAVLVSGCQKTADNAGDDAVTALEKSPESAIPEDVKSNSDASDASSDDAVTDKIISEGTGCPHKDQGGCGNCPRRGTDGQCDCADAADTVCSGCPHRDTEGNCNCPHGKNGSCYDCPLKKAGGCDGNCAGDCPRKKAGGCGHHEKPGCGHHRDNTFQP